MPHPFNTFVTVFQQSHLKTAFYKFCSCKNVCGTVQTFIYFMYGIMSMKYNATFLWRSIMGNPCHFFKSQKLSEEIQSILLSL